MNYSSQKSSKNSLRHIFTVDVEDWYHGIPNAQIAANKRRLDYSLGLLLEILAEYKVKGTFFWLGEAAVENPHLVKQVASCGHELGCHGWKHQMIQSMTPQEFRKNTKHAADFVADLTGKPVLGYRAPYFSITQSTLWALEILADLGFIYDSSIFPIHNSRYGIPEFDNQPQQINTSRGLIYEVPLSARQIFKKNIPVSGGGYFRLYPYKFTRSNFRALEQAGNHVVFYIHPWELDVNHPPISPSWKERLKNNINRLTTVPKLRKLLEDFDFAPLSEVFGVS